MSDDFLEDWESKQGRGSLLLTSQLGEPVLNVGWVKVEVSPLSLDSEAVFQKDLCGLNIQRKIQGDFIIATKTNSPSFSERDYPLR